MGNYRSIVGVNAGLIVLGVLGLIQPTTSALFHRSRHAGDQPEKHAGAAVGGAGENEDPRIKLKNILDTTGSPVVDFYLYYIILTKD